MGLVTAVEVLEWLPGEFRAQNVVGRVMEVMEVASSSPPPWSILTGECAEDAVLLPGSHATMPFMTSETRWVRRQPITETTTY
jgi:hypothetical protein